VASIQADLNRRNAAVLVVSFTPPAKAKAFLAIHPVPFPVVTDPERAAYRALGLGRTTWSGILQWRSLWQYLRLMFRGWMPKRPMKHDDLLQLGGDFILDGQGRLVYAHPSQSATDRPSPRDLLAVLDRLSPAAT
jgi:peroxiredoxin